MKVNRSTLGFTLFDLIVTLAIVSILTAIIVPGYFTWLANYRLKTAITDLYANMHLARMRAMKTGAYCTTQFSMDGYIIYEDKDSDQVEDIGEIRVASAQWSRYGDVMLVKNTFVKGTISFTRTSLTRGGRGGFGAGRVTLSAGTGRQMSIVISSVGRIRVD